MLKSQSVTQGITCHAVKKEEEIFGALAVVDLSRLIFLVQHLKSIYNAETL